ncbi:MAG: thiamine diphosphokinase [Bdellovibrionales bacterium]|nr:thiamine diphosphokinase [Bdellovibrionales bacterium]
MAIQRSRIRKFLVVAHGEPLAPRQLRRLARGRYVICLDGAANDNPSLRPDLLLGDMDGISAPALRRMRRWKVPVLALTDQNTTDLEKALLWCAMHKAKDVVVVAATGRRMDHTLANVSLLRRFDRKGAVLEFRTGLERIRYLKNRRLSLAAKRGQRVAVFGAPEATVWSTGAKYPMTGLLLRWGILESVSNECTGRRFALRVEGEALLVMEEK